VTVQHIVLFRFAAPLPSADDSTLRQMIRDWPSAIGGFHALRFGVDLDYELTAETVIVPPLEPSG